MESSPAVAGNTIQYTAMDYCKGRVEKRRVSHGSLPVTASSPFLTGLTPKSSVPRGPDKRGLSTSKGFPKPLSEILYSPWGHEESDMTEQISPSQYKSNTLFSCYTYKKRKKEKTMKNLL